MHARASAAPSAYPLSVGKPAAMHLLLSGERIDADRAWQLGLLSVPPLATRGDVDGGRAPGAADRLRQPDRDGEHPRRRAPGSRSRGARPRGRARGPVHRVARRPGGHRLLRRASRPRLPRGALMTTPGRRWTQSVIKAVDAVVERTIRPRRQLPSTAGPTFPSEALADLGGRRSGRPADAQDAGRRRDEHCDVRRGPGAHRRGLRLDLDRLHDADALRASDPPAGVAASRSRRGSRACATGRRWEPSR